MKTTAGSIAFPTKSELRRPSIAGRCGTSLFPARPRDTLRLWISQRVPRSGRRSSTAAFALGDCAFSALLIDVEWLDGDALAELVRLAEAGLRGDPPTRSPRSGQASSRATIRRCLIALQALRKRRSPARSTRV